MDMKTTWFINVLLHVLSCSTNISAAPFSLCLLKVQMFSLLLFFKSFLQFVLVNIDVNKDISKLPQLLLEKHQSSCEICNCSTTEHVLKISESSACVGDRNNRRKRTLIKSQVFPGQCLLLLCSLLKNAHTFEEEATISLEANDSSQQTVLWVEPDPFQDHR